jgi:hypothetical protein
MVPSLRIGRCSGKTDAPAAREHGVAVGLRVLDAADHHGARKADTVAFGQQDGGGRVDGGDEKEGGIRCPQFGAHVADEVDVAGGVKQVHIQVADGERQYRGGDGALLVDFGGV